MKPLTNMINISLDTLMITELFSVDSVIITDTVYVSIPDTIKAINPTHYTKDPFFILAMITAGIAILALFLPHLIKSLIDYYTEIKSLKGLRLFIINNLNEIIEQVKKEIKDYKELSEYISDIEYRSFGLRRNTLIIIESVLNIKHSDIYSSLVNKFKGDKKEKLLQFNTLLKTLGLIKVHSENKKHNFFLFENNRKDIENRWKKAADTILSEYDIYLSRSAKNNYNIHADPFLLRLSQIQNEWYSSENKERFNFVMSKLIKPIQKLCKENISDHRAVKLMHISKEVYYAYVDMVSLRSNYSEVFAEGAKTLSKFKRNLQQVYNFYNV